MKEQKNEQEVALKEQLKRTLQRLSSKNYQPSTELTNRLFSFAEKLSKIRGRKVYGYLSPEMKTEVNNILKIAFTDKQLQPLYLEYQKTQQAFIRNYVDDLEIVRKKLNDAEHRFFEPSKTDNKELHNVVVKQALILSDETGKTVAEIQHRRASINLLSSLAGALSRQIRELHTFNKNAERDQKPHRNIIVGQEQRRKKWRNYIEQ